ncbi:MAG: bifunctional chorismate mutase/prephenate dehydrogenase [Xanthomonadales bacterium]|nr:bifunctional chorismate mutase/prephenate dehydrogenase [Xanthomonadales bacterium]
MLEELRARLSKVDQQILELIAQRQSLVQEIGATKQSAGIPTRDFAREKRVIDNARAHAEKLGLPLAMAEDIMHRLIEVSLQRQEQDRIARSTLGTDQKALVFGGAGKMGVWLSDFLASQGFAVEIVDLSDQPSPFVRCDDWQSRVDEFDLLAVCAPITASASILGEMVRLKPRGLIFDIASIKSPLRQSLRALSDAGCRVTSIHPMFGPDTQLLSGRHVIFCDVDNPAAMAAAKALFDGTMAEQVEMGLEDHDRMVAYVLGLSHALNIAFFTALRESGEAAGHLAELSSTTFDAQLAVARAVSRDNPYMYFEIQSLNDYRQAPLHSLQDALGRIHELIQRDDREGFARLMQLGEQYLANR